MLSKIEKLIENLEVGQFADGEKVDQKIVTAYTDLFQVLVESGNISMLLTHLASVNNLKTNGVTKCALMYIITTFINEYSKEVF